jgi:NADH:ubiquinone oxidoreductase subunit H
MLSGSAVGNWRQDAVPLVLAAFAFMVALLSENGRVPFDDPETHLELTMIHEAMLLDVGGPDLAFAFYGAALKFELMAAFFVMMVLPDFGGGWVRFAAVLLGIAAVSLAVGAIESAMARMRFLKTPHALMGAALVAALAVLLLVCSFGWLSLVRCMPRIITTTKCGIMVSALCARVSIPSAERLNTALLTITITLVTIAVTPLKSIS